MDKATIEAKQDDLLEWIWDKYEPPELLGKDFDKLRVTSIQLGYGNRLSIEIEEE